MQNKSLAKDYVERAGKRLLALKVLYDNEAWADTVREAQEIVELALKGLLKAHSIEVPRIHDVSNLLNEEKSAFPKKLQASLTRLAAISKSLRRDRELAFYGSEDLTPSEFYKEEDAKKAFDEATDVVKTVQPFI